MKLIARKSLTLFQFFYEMLSDEFQFLRLYDKHFLESFQLSR